MNYSKNLSLCAKKRLQLFLCVKVLCVLYLLAEETFSCSTSSFGTLLPAHGTDNPLSSLCTVFMSIDIGAREHFQRFLAVLLLYGGDPKELVLLKALSRFLAAI